MSDSQFFITEFDSKARHTWHYFFELFATSQFQVFTCRISDTELASLNTENIENLVKALQHFPIHLPRFIGSLDIQFSTEAAVKERCFGQQKMTISQIKWLHALSAVPVTLFFLKDFDHQFLVAAGDLLVSGHLIALQEEEGNDVNKNAGTELLINHWNLSVVTERLAHAARYFQLYCCHTGFDPAESIDAVLGRFPVKIGYADIKKSLPKDMAMNRERTGQAYIIQ